MRSPIVARGLRFFTADGLVCQASICWECNNVYGEAGGRPILDEFKAEHPTAQRLLQTLRDASVAVD